jgi:hypothetical protein
MAVATTKGSRRSEIEMRSTEARPSPRKWHEFHFQTMLKTTTQPINSSTPSTEIDSHIMKQENKLSTLHDLIILSGHYAQCKMQIAGHLDPTFFWQGSQGPMCCLLGSMSTVEEKVACADLARLICLAHNATACVTATESWLVLARPGEPLDLNQRPSEAPDRVEAVMLMGESHDRQRCEILKIIRSDNGKFFGLTKLNLPNASHEIKGRFTQFIPSQIPNLTMRLRARAKLQGKGVVIHSLT